MTDAIEVCCNGASPKSNRPLRLDYRSSVRGRNVRLNLPRFVDDVLHIPNRVLDLLELATYVYAADRRSLRGQRNAVEFHSWSRRFVFRMRVRDIAFWRRADVREALRDCLMFMTGDADYSFEFSGGHATPPTSLFDQAGIALPQSPHKYEVALFSGGLDSLSGAIEALRRPDLRLVLVSHKSQPGTKQVQRALVDALKTRLGDRVIPYGFECTLTGKRAVEETQRSRSFLYSAIGFAIARTYNLASLTIYENGVTSLNLARREDLMNARASRTTHPGTIAGLERVLSLVAESTFRIPTPAFMLTKKDIVSRIVNAGYSDLIASSTSCSRPFHRAGPATHCGRCFQCLDRRLAVFAAGAVQYEDAGLYTLDIARDPITDGEFKTTAMDYLRQAARFAEASQDQFHEEYVSELAEVLDALPIEGTDLDKITAVWSLMQTHGQSIREALRAMRNLHDDPFKPLLPGCLLSLVATREHLFKTRFEDGTGATGSSSSHPAAMAASTNNEKAKWRDMRALLSTPRQRGAKRKRAPVRDRSLASRIRRHSNPAPR